MLLLTTLYASSALAGTNTTQTWTLASPNTSPVNGVTVSISAVSGVTYAQDTLNSTNFWSNPYGTAVNGNPSLASTFSNIDVAGYTRTVTMTFSKAVDNPVLHVDRLGGGTQPGGFGPWVPLSTLWTLSGSTSTGGSVTLSKLAGNTQFLTTATSFQRSLTQSYDGNTECTTNGTACGSVQFTGTGITSLTFTVTAVFASGALTSGSGDGLEFAWSLKTATLQVAKQTVGGTGSFNFTATNAPIGSPLTLNTATSNPVSGPTPAALIPDDSSAVTITEAAAAGYALGSATCKDQSNATVTSSLSGQVLTIAANAYRANQDIVCTFVNNKLPLLTLVKAVNNTYGGTQTATAWTLNATGSTNISGVSGAAAVTNAQVQPGTYTLGESAGPAGYTASLYSCSKNGAAAVSGNSITLAFGDSATCTITNSDQAATLTLSKTVSNTHGGTQSATAWTLSAAGPSNISGATGTAAVTGAAVKAGTYTLSESGPANYTASAWSCSAGTLSGNSLTLALGQTATCSITNSDSSVADISVTKTDGKTSVTSGTQTSYTVVVTNNGPAWGNNSTVTDAPGTGLNSCTAICTGTTGGALCPATPANLVNAGGVTIGTFPANSSVTFAVTCNVN